MMVRIFIDRLFFFFPPVKRSHLELEQLPLALLPYCEKLRDLEDLGIFKPAVADCHPQ